MKYGTTLLLYQHVKIWEVWFMDKRYQVFVSSTYADLKEERSKVIQALMEMDCIPAGMELFPAADEEQWAFIQKVIDDYPNSEKVCASRLKQGYAFVSRDEKDKARIFLIEVTKKCPKTREAAKAETKLKTL